MELEGPAYTVCAPKAVAAVGRVFRNVDFVGKTKQEVFAILGEPKDDFARDEGAEGAIVYRYDTGGSGMEYKLVFGHGRVHSVYSVSLE